MAPPGKNPGVRAGPSQGHCHENQQQRWGKRAWRGWQGVSRGHAVQRHRGTASLLHPPTPPEVSSGWGGSWAVSLRRCPCGLGMFSSVLKLDDCRTTLGRLEKGGPLWPDGRLTCSPRRPCAFMVCYGGRVCPGGRGPPSRAAGLGHICSGSGKAGPPLLPTNPRGHLLCIPTPPISPCN